MKYSSFSKESLDMFAASAANHHRVQRKNKQKIKSFIIPVSSLSSQSVGFKRMTTDSLPPFLFLFTLTGTNPYCCAV